MEGKLPHVNKLSDITQTGLYYIEETEEKLPINSKIFVEYIKLEHDEQMVSIRKSGMKNPKIYQRIKRNGYWLKWMYVNEDKFWEFLNY